MPNVWDAMKKHRSEQASQPAPPVQPPSSPVGVSEAPAPASPPVRLASLIAAAAPALVPSGMTEAMATYVARDGQYSEFLVAHHDRGSSITEEFRALRTSLLASCDQERFCYMLTSAEPGEGKTVTSMNLAMVMAERVDRNTIVVDCDLRKGRVATLMNAKASPGLADVLRGSATLAECIQPTCYPNLSIVTGGSAKQSEVGEILGRPVLEDVVTDLRRRYDFVIFDAPPINELSDAGIVGRVVGESLLVVRMSKTHKESVDKAIRLLHAANVKLVGIVLSQRKYYVPNYIYRY